MSRSTVIDRFFHLRWPAGYRCPRCAHFEYCEIRTRSLPLYQCKRCRCQSTVTSGTVMHKSRTPLDRWLAAIDALTSSNGLCSDKLAALIGVTRKVGYTMLHKFREAIGKAEADRKLEGSVRTGLCVLAPKRIWLFVPNRRYRGERIVALSASVDTSGKPKALKLLKVDDKELIPEMKTATLAGRDRIMSRIASPHADVRWIGEWRKFPEPLEETFRDARQWLIETFNGIGTKYLQGYLDEFCFRHNAAAGGESLLDSWLHLCFRYGKQSRAKISSKF